MCDTRFERCWPIIYHWSSDLMQAEDDSGRSLVHSCNAIVAKLPKSPGKPNIPPAWKGLNRVKPHSRIYIEEEYIASVCATLLLHLPKLVKYAYTVILVLSLFTCTLKIWRGCPFSLSRSPTQRWLTGKVVTQEKIDQAKSIYDAHLRPGLFHHEGWKYILDRHGGKLPVVIKAVPEGSVIPYRNGRYTT